jgi:hypothetical protein
MDILDGIDGVLAAVHAFCFPKVFGIWRKNGGFTGFALYFSFLFFFPHGFPQY